MPATVNLGLAKQKALLRPGMLSIKLFVLVVGGIFIWWISRASINKTGSHGFYRFLAWESLLLLFLLNMDHWFKDPFSWNQWIAWSFFIISIVPVIWGTILLRRNGKPDTNRAEDPSLFAIERTTQLVTTGIYRYIRHPLYSSLLFLAWGIFFKNISWASLSITLVATGFIFLTALADENECCQYFGKIYLDYMKKTRRFIPFIL